MGKLDLALTLIFTPLSLGACTFAVFCFRKALKVSGERDGDLKMFLWSAGSMVGLIVGGMIAAYILLPILIAYTST
jgi:hypothetical protein